jgi:hypothetical protein
MNKQITLFLLNNFSDSIMFYGDIQSAIAKLSGQYSDPIVIEVDVKFSDGKSACEEIFDLTNNPCRQKEREEKYGRGRSVSVGDIVGVDDETAGVTELYVCAPCGWVKV